MDKEIKSGEICGERRGFVIKTAQKLITVVIVLMSVGLTLIDRPLSYHDGLNGGRGVVSAVCVLWIPFLWMGVFFLLLCQCIIVALTVYRYGLKRSGKYLGSLGICVIAICVCWFFLMGKPGFDPFSEGFAQKMGNEANIQDIQKWLGSRAKSSPLSSSELDRNNWPDAVKILQPKYAYLEMIDANTAKVRLVWGGAFASWGIVVGPPGMRVPESDIRRGGEYRLELAPGSYVWHEVR